MSRLRILVLAAGCNPDSVSVPYVSYAHAEALAQLHDVTLVIGESVEKPVRNAKARFRGIEVIRTPWLDRVFAWSSRRIFRNHFSSQILTAFTYPFTLAFEFYAWRSLRQRIFSGEFDVVWRVFPITAVLPSPFAFFLRKGPIPFVIGPINGGLPWPSGFGQLKRQKQWISRFRGLYRHLPFARSTYRRASAIIAASSQTYAEFSMYREKLFFVPENGVSAEMCSRDAHHSAPCDKVDLVFLGMLVPFKGCDLALRAAAPLLKGFSAHLSILGDGPDRGRLEHLAKSLEVDRAVSFCGWVEHKESISRLKSADILVFPSVREFGGGVIFEALACGSVPVVVDFGGPGDIIHPAVGYKVPLTNEEDVVIQMRKALTELVSNRDHLNQLRRQGMTYARERLTWEAKAQDTSRVLRWAVREGERPNFPPPKVLLADAAASTSC